MNAKSSIFEIQCEARQSAEVVACLFHSILFHRTCGKFHYKHDSTYTIGTLGFEEVLCDFIDMTYVRCSSPSLVQTVNKQIDDFVTKLRALEAPSAAPSAAGPSRQIQGGCNGIINLEFYLRNNRWKISDPHLVWEIWTLKLNCDQRSSPNVPQLEDVLLEKLFQIVQTVNSDRFLPPPVSQQNLGNIFDTTHPDVQPYLFKINYGVGSSMRGGGLKNFAGFAGGFQQKDGPPLSSPGAMKKLLKDFLAF